MENSDDFAAPAMNLDVRSSFDFFGMGRQSGFPPAPLFGSISGSASSDSLMINLDEIFADDFFPEDLDFTSFLFFDENDPMEADSVPSSVMFQDSSKTVAIPPLAEPAAASSSSSTSSTSRQTRSGSTTRSVQLGNGPTQSSVVSQQASMQAAEESDKNSKPENLKKRRRRSKAALADEVVSEEAPLTEAEKIERRERNREHARNSRARKRMMLSILQAQLSALRRENGKLRRVVSDRLPSNTATTILQRCTTQESRLLSFSDDDEDQNGREGPASPNNIASKVAQQQQPERLLMEPDFRLVQALIKSQGNFVLSDPSLPDNPIVYCSNGFCKLTGYKRQVVIGRNCRFLQGPGTDQAAVDVIRAGVKEGRDISVCLRNYKADGTPFWNQFFVAALRDSNGAVVNFVGVQCEVNAASLEQIKDRIKHLPVRAAELPLTGNT